MWGCSGLYVEGLAIPEDTPAEGRKARAGQWGEVNLACMVAKGHL